jgi:hypothetical protein
MKIFLALDCRYPETSQKIWKLMEAIAFENPQKTPLPSALIAVKNRIEELIVYFIILLSFLNCLDGTLKGEGELRCQ